MSGGSFDYLYSRDENELLTRVHDLERMVHELSGYQNGGQASRDTEVITTSLRAIQTWLRTPRGVAIRDVWRAVEWERSGDDSRSDVTQALAIYNGTDP